MPTHAWTRRLAPDEWLRLAAFGVAVAALHAIGCGLFVYYSSRYPSMAGLGLTAYLLGLRHAFDADHIAAIDNTTRKLLQEDQRPIGVGFFFSLGHSSVVFALVAAFALGERTAHARFPAATHYGYIGTGVSGTFLWIIGILNLIVLADIVRILREIRRGDYDPQRLEQLLRRRGMMSRAFQRCFGLINRSWQMYPVGFLFGLGFDTATEVGLLALAAGIATHAVPLAAIISLPVLFAAGMSLMDTLDGAFMNHAYGWAFSNPIRKIYYNITVTSLSVAIALAVGTVELLQVVSTQLVLSGGFWARIQALDLGTLGYAVVVLFVLSWATSASIWKLCNLERRWSPAKARSSTPSADVMPP